MDKDYKKIIQAYAEKIEYITVGDESYPFQLKHMYLNGEKNGVRQRLYEFATKNNIDLDYVDELLSSYDMSLNNVKTR